MNDDELQRAVSGLPKSIEPPHDLWPGIEARIQRRRSWYWIPLAVAAMLVLLLIARSIQTQPAWDVTMLAGRPLLGTSRLTASGRMRVGDWLQTDDSSRALIAVGHIGQVEVQPGTRLQLVAARARDHRLALAHGSIDATVDAVPRLFFVETPAGTAIDLGCAYTLETDSLGNGRLHVTRGEVEFETGSRISRVPLGAIIQTRAAVGRPGGPGIPYVEDAPAPLIRALIAFDFEKGGGEGGAGGAGGAR
ncbi:MAG TPA: FecR domain-containing protein, partial [Myxococcales bacterium]|nr:FecR domain-containing protein [Myxococcales bacterium]